MGTPLPPPRLTTRTSGQAVASLVLGILWFGWIGSILAIVLGYRALNEIDASSGLIAGKGMAIAGLVLGLAAVSALVVPFWVAVG